MTDRDYYVDVPLRWSDMDAYAHVNNVQFLRLLEDARVVAIREWLGEREDMLRTGVLVARHEIEYLAPLDFRPAPVRIFMWTKAIGGANVDIGYDVCDPDDIGTTTYARAETTLVAYDFASASPRRLSADERAALAEHAGGPVGFRRRLR